MHKFVNIINFLSICNKYCSNFLKILPYNKTCITKILKKNKNFSLAREKVTHSFGTSSLQKIKD